MAARPGSGFPRSGFPRSGFPDPGSTLLQHAAETLTAISETVEIAAGTPERLDGCGWPRFPDVAPDSGPLAGLLAALERAEALGLDGVLALACDMPLVGLQELQPLVAALEGADAALWIVEGRPQPLCAAYRSACRAPARRAFDGGVRKLTAFLGDQGADGARLRVRRIAADENSAHRLVNVNTPSDYDRALRDATVAATPRRPSPHDR